MPRTLSGGRTLASSDRDALAEALDELAGALREYHSDELPAIADVAGLPVTSSDTNRT